jgi:hypothetical protein
MGFAKIDAVILGFFQVAVLGREQIFVPHPPAVPVIQFRILYNPSIRGTATCDKKYGDAQYDTEKTYCETLGRSSIKNVETQH